MRNPAFLVATLLLVLSACSIPVELPVSPQVKIVSSDEPRVPGRFILIVDRSLTDIHQEIKPSSYTCSYHSYPLVMGEALIPSLAGAMQQAFENITIAQSIPSSESTGARGLRGVVLLSMDAFDSQIHCRLWSGSCTATTRLSLGVTVRSSQGRLWRTAVVSSKTSAGHVGACCVESASVLADSVGKALTDALDQVTRRIATSPALREVSTDMSTSTLQ